MLNRGLGDFLAGNKEVNGPSELWTEAQRAREQRAPFQKAGVVGVLSMAEKSAEPCLQLETGVCSPSSKSVCRVGVGLLSLPG